MELTEAQRKRFHMAPLAQYLDDFGHSADTEISWYCTFLLQSDYIIHKITEAQLLGHDYDPEDLAVLELRGQARRRINELQQNQ